MINFYTSDCSVSRQSKGLKRMMTSVMIVEVFGALSLTASEKMTRDFPAAGAG